MLICRLFLYTILLLLAACEDYPKDPRHTLVTIREKGRITVGVVHNPVWVDIRTFPPSGKEVNLIQEFAAMLEATPQWKVVDMETGITQLEAGELDVLIGGILQSTPYKNAGFTRPYRITHSSKGEKRNHVMAVRRGENRFLITLERFLKHASTNGAAQ